MLRERLEVLGTAPRRLPHPDGTTDYLKTSSKPTAYRLLRQANAEGRLLLQPRSGVGAHNNMVRLLQALERGAQPDIQSVTIDSHTRLGDFPTALRVLNQTPHHLNGYPLPSHGFRRGREINESVGAPVEVRHGSPRPKVLFEVSLASGFTAFEGGGLTYNLPYAKNVPIAESLDAWGYVDRVCGCLATEDIIIDREFFGTLSAVLVPPAISLVMTLLEAMLAARAGVRSLSVAYGQGGHAVQDLAALNAIRTLAAQFVPGVDVFPVLHEYMGPFPKERWRADSLIAYGAVIARAGGATKLVTKTHDEALGIPTVDANIAGLRTARQSVRHAALSGRIDPSEVEEERRAIEREVQDILEPVLIGPDLVASIVDAFARGRLDMPFSTSRHAHSSVIAIRDHEGAIRFWDAGNLPLSGDALKRNNARVPRIAASDLLPRLRRDINWFARK